MRRVHIAALVAGLIVVGAGLVHGKLYDRWGSSQALEDAVARVDQVPMEIDGLIGETQSAEAEEFRAARAKGYWVRTYRDPDRKTECLVILMCGRPGDMSIHTPDVCYKGAGYEMFGQPSTAAIGELGLFWTARFVKQSLGNDDLRLYWAWTNDGAWRAPESPRWEFRGGRFLYKLYIARRASGRDDAKEKETTEAIMRRLLPAFRQTLFAETAVAKTEG
ncbi:MAG: exosortase-associated EpsI family protein [Gemmataceae bacterium]